MFLPKTRGLVARARIYATIVLASAGGCGREPVEWEDSIRSVSSSSGMDQLRIDSAGHMTVVASVVAPARDDACAGSVRAVERGVEQFAAWWSAAPSSPARLLFARSADAGETWSAPVVVDARDAGTRGCDRPALAIAIGAASDYVHLAYWIEPADGAGVFFSHSLDGGLGFHAPVAVAYGGHASRAAVASLGDTVVVVHEDPNSERARLLMALSLTAGHIFEHRLALPQTSAAQSSPQIAIRPGEVFVGWREPGGSMLFVRRGRIATD